MNEFFKGFILTNNKQAIEKFKNRTDFKTYDEIKKADEFAGILADDTILIDVDDFEQSEILLDIIDDLGIKCKVLKTTRGKHFYFKNKNLNGCKTHTKLACGIIADIKVGVKNSYSILKFAGKEREILYDKLDNEEYDEIPKWLYPVKTNLNFQDLNEGDGRNQSLFNYILTLQSNDFTVEEVRKTIEIINNYILPEPLKKSELETILRDDAFNKPAFYKGNQFLFDKFAIFLKNNHHIIKLNNQLYVYKDGIYINAYTGVIEHLMIEYIPALSKRNRNEVMSYLEVLIDENSNYSSVNYIAFKNGIYKLDTNEFLDFTPSIILTNKIDVNFNIDAYSSIVDDTLNKLSCNDKKIRMLLEEVIGACFYRSNSLGGGRAFILTGEKSNGKSTFIYMLQKLLGNDNITSLDLGEIGDRFRTEKLVDVLANLGDDISDDFINGSGAAIFKKVVTGDRILVERKGRDPYDVNLFCKLIFSSNNIPRIKDKTGAVLRRLCIVPFDATFSINDADYDPNIKFKLTTSESLEYLVQLGINGLKRVLKNKTYTINARIEEELAEYEEYNNPILGFLKEINESDVINNNTNEVYQKYNEYCLTNNFTAMSKIEFSKKICRYFNVESKLIRLNDKVMRIFRIKK